MQKKVETVTLIEFYHATEDHFIGEIDITQYGFELLRQIAPPYQVDDPIIMIQEILSRKSSQR